MLGFGDLGCESSSSPCVKEYLWFPCWACGLHWPQVNVCWCDAAEKVGEGCGFRVLIQRKPAASKWNPKTTHWCIHTLTCTRRRGRRWNMCDPCGDRAARERGLKLSLDSVHSTNTFKGSFSINTLTHKQPRIHTNKVMFADELASVC